MDDLQSKRVILGSSISGEVCGNTGITVLPLPIFLCCVSAFCIEGLALDAEGLDASAKGRRIKCRVLGLVLTKKAV
jgi:hypothetical protein